MAELPRFNSRASISGEAPASLTDVNSAKTVGRSVTGLGRAIKGVADKFQNAIDSTQKTTKQNELSLGTADILKRSKEENKPIETYQNELEDLRISAADGFTNNQALASFRPDIDRSINAASVKLNGIFRAKILDQKTAGRILQSAVNREGFMRDGEQSHIDLELSQIATTLEEGFIDNEEAAKQTVKANKLPEDRAKTLKAMDTLVKRQLKLNRINNELDIINEMRTKGLVGMNIGDIIDQAGSDEDDSIRNEFARAMTAFMVNPEVYEEAKLNNPDFDNFIENVLKSNDKQKINNILLEALNQKGKVSFDEMSIIIGVSTAKSGTLKGIETNEGNVAQSDKFTFLDGLKFFFTNKAPKSNEVENKSQNIRTYVERVEMGEEPDIVLDDIQRQQRLKDFPIMKSFPKDGILKTDSNGITRRLFPTGEIRTE